MPENVSDQFADAYTAHAVDLSRLSEGMAGTVRFQLNELADVLTSQIAIADIPGVKTNQRRLAKQKALLEQAKKSIGASYTKTGQFIGSQLIELAQIEGPNTVNLLDRVLEVEAGVGLTPKQLESVAKGTLINGSPLKPWIEKLGGDTAFRYEQELRLGLLQGETNDQLVRRIRGGATGKRVRLTDERGRTKVIPEFRGGVIESSTREATAFVRSSVQAVANETNEAVYGENQDVLKGRQALVALDTRTSKICIARSGGAWDFDNKPLKESPVQEPFPGPPPWHPNCRTILIPITKSIEELTGIKGLPEFKASTQASMDGQVAADLNYESWLKTKPVEFQKEILGPARWQMWNDGKLESLSQLIDQSGHPLTIPQLREKLGVPAPIAPVSAAPPPPAVVPKLWEQYGREVLWKGGKTIPQLDILPSTPADARETLLERARLADSLPVKPPGTPLTPDDLKAAPDLLDRMKAAQEMADTLGQIDSPYIYQDLDKAEAIYTKLHDLGNVPEVRKLKEISERAERQLRGIKFKRLEARQINEAAENIRKGLLPGPAEGVGVEQSLTTYAERQYGLLDLSVDDLEDFNTDYEIWAQSMASIERKVLRGYTGGDYFRMNSYMRGALTNTDMSMYPTAWDWSVIEDRITILDHVLARAPGLDTSVSTWRGMTIDKDDLRKYVVGNVVEKQTFVSTSAVIDTAKDFARAGGEGTTGLLIEFRGNKFGVPLESMTGTAEEYEVLFRPKTRFKVVESYPDPNDRQRHILVMEEVSGP